MVQPIKKKAPKGALERIEDLEKTIPSIVSAINEALVRADNRSTELSEVVDTLIELAGRETVTAAINSAREKRDRERAAAAEQALSDAIGRGEIASTDSVAENCLIAGVEYDKEGAPIPPGRVQVMTNQVVETVRTQILGKGPGTKADTPNGGTFEVTDIYAFVPKKEEVAALTPSEVLPPETGPSTVQEGV